MDVFGDGKVFGRLFVPRKGARPMEGGTGRWVGNYRWEPTEFVLTLVGRFLYRPASMNKPAKSITVGLWAIVLGAIFGPIVRGADAPAAASPSAFRVVVLHNGNALAGQFDQVGDRITVTQGPGHTVRVPVDEVDFIVPRWRDAYRHLRSRLRAGSLEDRLRLAQWCLRYDQVDAATDLLLEMSRQYPQHSAIRALEQQLARRAGMTEGEANGTKVQAASFETADAQTVESRLSIPLDQVAASPGATASSAPQEAENSAAAALARNMEPAAVTEFTRTIQPLLLNRCGMANCHAPSGRSVFKVQKIPLGKLTHRDLTWINLQHVLQRIDAQNPDDSELLARAVTPHGKSRRAPIDTHQVRQRERLRQWVLMVAGDSSSQEWAAQQLGEVPAAPIPQQMPTPTAGWKALNEAMQGSGPVTPASFDEVEEAGGEAEDQPKPAPQEDSKDPFDPERFNRDHDR